MEKIIERVQKLLALAGNNSNENEAAAAIEKAHAILAAHNLSMATVQEHGNAPSPDDERGAMRNETNFSENHYSWIWNKVAEVNYCSCFSSRPDPKKRQTFYNVVGRKINVIVATQMAMYLCQTIRRLANEEAKRRGITKHSFKNSFLQGAALRICDRLEAMREREERQENALVLWTGNEQEANEAFIRDSLGVKDLITRGPKELKVNVRGFEAGTSAGDRVSFAQQVADSSETVKRIK